MILDIKGTIKSHGLEVRTVAERMGITPTALSQHINGKMYRGRRVAPNPSVDVLQRIASAIGCDMAELFAPDGVGAELTALVEHKGKFYKAATVRELDDVLNAIKKQL